MSNGEQCPLTRASAKIQTLSNIAMGYQIHSEICGRYFITEGLIQELNSKPNIDNQHLNLAFETLILQKIGKVTAWQKTGNQNVQWPDPNAEIRVFENYANLPIVHSDKPDNLLKLVADKLQGNDPFFPIGFKKSDSFILKMRGFVELTEWLWILQERGHISISVQHGTQVKTKSGWMNQLTSEQTICLMTPSGWKHIESLYKSINSKTVFIVQSFNENIKTEIREAIKAACSSCGWEAASVECEQYNGIVMDEVIAKIRKSAFVVSDLTDHRNGVYYEAGFAEGLGLPVIYTVRHGDHVNTHFDVNHLNLIVWKDTADLKTKLKNRIEATISR